MACPPGLTAFSSAARITLQGRDRFRTRRWPSRTPACIVCAAVLPEQIAVIEETGMSYSWGRRHAIVLAAIAIAITTGACSAGLPKPDSQEYRDLVAAFYVGLSGLQTGEDVRALQRLTQATELAPGEPAGWANLGLLAVRHQDLEKAYEHVEKARSLAPNNSQIEALLGLIESRRGKLPEAIAHLKRAAELDPANLRALYSLSQETERQGSDAADAEAQQWLQKILAAQPENLAVLLEVARLAAKRGDGETLKMTTSRLTAKSALWPAGAKEQMTALEQAAAGPNPRSAALQTAFLRNLLAPTPEFRQSRNAVSTPVEFASEPFLKFINLPSPSSRTCGPGSGNDVFHREYSRH